MAKDKDTIYIDVDDEITGIIDKVKASEGKIVALVLPKRAAVFQSIVNMKLLKRAVDGSKKNLVLITSEAGLLPLAGAAGIHVAKTLTSKPEIPSAPEPEPDEETIPETAVAGPELDKETPVGDLAGPPKPPADGVETVTLPDEDLAEAAAAAKGAKTFEPPKKKKNKKLAVPNFERFRLWLLIGGGLLVLFIIFFIVATFALPKATINISTDATNINTNLNLGLSATAKALDPVNNILPAKLASEQKTYSQQVATTGQKNNGNKAAGSVLLTNCSSNDVTIPAGSGFSSNGNTYITQNDIAVPDSNFTSPGSGSKCKNDGKASVDVVAQNGGASYNLSNGSLVSTGVSGVTGQSNSIAGGTDNIVQTVNQNDINNAKGKIVANDPQLKQDLQTQLKGGNFYPIVATYSAGTPTVTTSAPVGSVASSVAVTEVVTYTMFGVKEADLTTVVDNQVDSQIDTNKQSVLDTGLANGVFNVTNLAADSAQLNLSTVAVAGPHLDVSTIQKEAAGQRAGAIKSQLSTNPDVTSVNVSISPFWVSTAPKKTSRITVHIAKPKTTKASSPSASQP